MANVMTKRGSQDNVVTYKHVCDKYADMADIDSSQINLGSTCLVLQGQSGGVETYIANTEKQWILLSHGGSSSSSNDDIPTDVDRVTEEELEEMLNG